MTYTVKNGTWCKDNEKEYYSATETGLKAALKAGEITSGTRVVIHKPKYHAGQLIQSLNPECPEGCFVPHGQPFDTSIYEDLAKVFPDGKLPDLRECVLVCAGENETLGITAHDVFNAGEFKDDQTQLHVHSRGTMNVTGAFPVDSNSKSFNGAFSRGEYAGKQSGTGTGHACTVNFNASSAWIGQTSDPEGKSVGYEPITPVSNPAAEGLYEHPTTLVPSIEQVCDPLVTYYDSTGAVIDPQAVPLDPSVLDLYEFDGTDYVPTADITADWSKKYYDSEQNEVSLYDYIDPSALGWYIKVEGSEYVLTTDATIIPGKLYYKRVEAGASARTGNTTRTKQYGVYYYIAF